MKRGLVLSMSALALLMAGRDAQAQAPGGTVNISLNLRYTDPADPVQGGQWFLAVKGPAAGNGSGGIAGLSAYLTNIDTSGIVFGSPAVGSVPAGSNYVAVTGATLGANVDTPGGTPFNTTFLGSAANPDVPNQIVNVVYGQNNSPDPDGGGPLPAGAIVANVGKVGGPGSQGNDPLQNTAWNDSAVLISGTFAGGGTAGNLWNRPAFVTDVGTEPNNTDANTYPAGQTNVNPVVTPVAALDADVTLTVRGDSLATLGLEGGGEGLSVGDPNRDLTIGTADFSIVSNNFFTAQGWDNGDVDGSSDGQVGTADFSAVSNNFFTSQIPPSAAAVPEPASVALAALGLIATLAVRRRK